MNDEDEVPLTDIDAEPCLRNERRGRVSKCAGASGAGEILE